MSTNTQRFFFPDTNRIAEQLKKEQEEKAKEYLTRDDVLQSLARQLTLFAKLNGISEDDARIILVKAEKSEEAQNCKENNFFKFNDFVFKIAQKIIDNDSHIHDAKTPPTSPKA